MMDYVIRVLIQLVIFTIVYFIGIFAGQWLFGKVDSEGRKWLALGYIIVAINIIIRG
jgi:uncharacterized membrane protein YfcA